MYKELFINIRKKFIDSLEHPLENQTKVLMEILNTNKNCEYGSKYNFSSIKDIKDFQKNVVSLLGTPASHSIRAFFLLLYLKKKARHIILG